MTRKLMNRVKKLEGKLAPKIRFDIREAFDVKSQFVDEHTAGYNDKQRGDYS